MSPMGINEDAILVIVAVVMLLLGFAIAWLLYAMPLATARERLHALQVERDADQRVHAEQKRLHEESAENMRNTFSALSQHALRENNTQFLQLAQESLMRFHQGARSELEGKKEAFREMIEPIQSALDETRKQVHRIEKERLQSFGQVSQQLQGVASEQQELRQQTQRLVTALKRPEVRGQWGEMTLKRLVEMAGMVEHCDFIEQVHESRDGRIVRPDLIVRMPDRRELIVDAKAPLDAYLQASETDDPEKQRQEFVRHARIVREHVVALAAKKYWEQFDQAPDFVILFVPGEQFLGAALEYDKKLLNDAMAKKVILASPTTLIALLRSVSYGWKQVSLSENAARIQQLGEDVYKRISVLTEHMSRLGKSINSSVEHYNRTLGSLERTVLPGVKRFADLGIREDRPMTENAPLENHARAPVPEESDKQQVCL